MLDQFLKVENLGVDLIVIVSVVVTNIIILMTAYIKFKTVVLSTSEEIKKHADISVQKLNGMLTYLIHSFDRPIWVKIAYTEKGIVRFRMSEVNQAYTEVFGIARDKYIGKTDLEVGWPKKTADEFYKHDLEVWATGEAKTFTETVSGKQVKFRKILLQTPDGKKKGVMGYMAEMPDDKANLIQKI